MKTPLLVAVLAACGDNLQPVPDQIDLAQSAESSIVVTGTYTPTITHPPFSDDVVAWTLSPGGVVLIEISGLQRMDMVDATRLRGDSLDEPTVAVVDQVDDESLNLACSTSGMISGGRGLVTYTLDEPLLLGSAGELVWLRVSATQSALVLYGITTTVERTP